MEAENIGKKQKGEACGNRCGILRPRAMLSGLHVNYETLEVISSELRPAESDQEQHLKQAAAIAEKQTLT